MSSAKQYADELSTLPSEQWPSYLNEHSGLPGRRANLTLMQTVADTGQRAIFDDLIRSGEEYLVCCGVVGLGAALAEGDDVEAALRQHAADHRWRVREAVAMALQRLGDVDASRLTALVFDWVDDDHPLVQRAAVAGICEPRLLTNDRTATAARQACRRATDHLAALPRERRTDPDVRTLRQALGYCWSVAVAAAPEPGIPAFLALGDAPDADVAWIVRENRKKKRLAKLLDAGASPTSALRPTADR
ncbi:MAG: HEAT repeat domain-containing protein [Propioniciclava sp.]|uniref:HEAT repeat domain-containing protein n=1 Tax=Propioniciclava sp. TaxID=2038686 RepID=UPI0039E3D2A3